MAKKREVRFASTADLLSGQLFNFLLVSACPASVAHGSFPLQGLPQCDRNQRHTGRHCEAGEGPEPGGARNRGQGARRNAGRPGRLCLLLNFRHYLLMKTGIDRRR